MKKITLILGGARSGKSTCAEMLAKNSGLPVTYLATAEALDDEMKERVRQHKARRPAAWDTWEGSPEDLPEAVKKMRGVLLLDCLTMWLTRLMLATGAGENGEEDEWRMRELEIKALTERLCLSVNEASHLIIVSNEVGCGLVPTYQMGRRFRDLQGRMNQLCAGFASRVALVVAGCPLWVKGGQND